MATTTGCGFSMPRTPMAVIPMWPRRSNMFRETRSQCLRNRGRGDPAGMRADLDRFRKELGTDYIDVFLMHCLTEGDWTERYKGVMEVLSEARQKGVIRAHGCSCHSIEALRAAAKSPWVDVDLVRINPVGAYMDADPDTVLAVLLEMRAAGKGLVGMKILGQGELRHRQDEALRFALSLNLLDAFTIGAESRSEQED